MIAANKKMRKIAYRRYFASHRGDTTPTSSRKTSKTGSRNDSPNASVTSITNETYRSKLRRDTTPVPANPRRKLSARGRVKYENRPPATNRTNEQSTNGIDHFFSRAVRPGTMNAQSWYSRIGRAIAIAMNN